MHILVTGGCGYVGSCLVPALLARGDRVTVADVMWFGSFLEPHENLEVREADTRDIDSIPMDGVDTVIHLANVANDPCSELNAKLSWEVNVLATMRLVERAIVCGAKQFIYASSGSVYGVKEEAQVTEDLSLVPISDYNKTKMVAERVLMSYADDILFQAVRPATVCGVSPRMRLDVSVNLLTMQALKNGRITVFGGDQTRPNIHMKDMVRVYLHLLEQGARAPGIYNAGFENISILDVAKRIADAIPAEISVTESNDPRSYRQNSDKLQATGFTPMYSVDYAISEIAEAYAAGTLKDEDRWYNIRSMKKLGLDTAS